MRKLKRFLSAAVALCLAVSVFTTTALADSSFTFTTPEEPMDVSGSADVLTTLTQRAASEIPLIFGLNVVGGNMFTGLQYLGGTSVNESPDPYIWNFNYLYPDYERMTDPGEAAEGRELPDGTYYKALGNTLNNPNGLYSSGGANQNYSVAMDELGGVGYAVGYRNDVIIGFNSQTVDQIDLVRSWKAGDEYYQAGDENYSPLVIDVQTGSVTSRLYAWTEMGQAISAYLAEHPDKTTRYDDPYTIAVNLEQFSAGIPYYIASLIADGSIEKKTAAYVGSIDGYTLTCVDPGTVGTVGADVYAEVYNFNFLTGSYTLSDLMDKNVDVIMLGASGYGYTADSTVSTIGGGRGTTGSDKPQILAELAGLGYSAGEMPLVMDSNTINVTIGTNGYNYAPTTPLLVPYVQAYAYFEELEKVNPAVNPVAMLQYAVDEFCHVEESASADVALYYIGSNWDSVDEDYDRVPDLAGYKYDKAAIEAAIKAGITYALSGQAAANGNTLLPAYRVDDNAYTILMEHTTSAKPAEDHEYITLTIKGQTKYLDLTDLAASSGKEADNVIDGGTQFEYYDTRTEYQAIIDYYNSGEYGYGDDLQTTLQNYADHMVAHVWEPDTTVAGTYGYGLKASGDTAAPSTGYTDVAGSAWYASAVEYVSENGIMSGFTDGTFQPQGELSRAQLCQIIYNLEGAPASSGESVFSDVTASNWYAPAVLWCYENGIVTGRTETAFDPNVSITRQDVAVILYRYADYLGIETEAGDLSAFADASSVSSYAAQAMSWAVGSGLITGVTDTTLVPRGTAARAQIAAIMMRFCEAA